MTGSLLPATHASTPAYSTVNSIGGTSCSVDIPVGDALTFDEADVVFTPDGADVQVIGTGSLKINEQQFKVAQNADPAITLRWSLNSLVASASLSPPTIGAGLSAQLQSSGPATLRGAIVGAAEAIFPGSRVVIPVNTLVALPTMHIRAYGTISDAAGASALTLRIRIGENDSIADTLIAESAAFDGANGDIIMIDCIVSFRGFGAGGTLVAAAFTTVGTPGGTTSMEPFIIAATAIDYTALNFLNVSCLFSANDTDLTLEQFVVQHNHS